MFKNSEKNLSVRLKKLVADNDTGTLKRNRKACEFAVGAKLQYKDVCNEFPHLLRLKL
jgi:hypothetical protein